MSRETRSARMNQITYSRAGRIDEAENTTRLQRSFHSPHHTFIHAGLIRLRELANPGEISLAHRRVLFLDELPEFGMRVLEVLRQPIEDKGSLRLLCSTVAA